MRRRSRIALAALAFALAAAPAVPQVSSAPVAQVDSWGVGWLGANDAPIPTTFWANTNGDALGPVFAALQPKDLSPASRALLRRMMLSRSKAPAGGPALVPERLRLIEQLGEAAHSADLRKRYADTDWGKPGDRLSLELDLVAGNKDACARTTGKPAANRDWMPVRALCSALAGDANTNLIVEQIATTDETLGVWLIAATGAIAAPEGKKPEGRFATPLEAAVSVAAKLPTTASALAVAPPDIAAAIVKNPNATLEQKRAALRSAIDGGRLKTSEVLAVLTAKDETPAAKPASTARSAPRPDPLGAALVAFATADAKPELKAAAYDAALRGAETPSDARLASVALAEAIKALPKNEATAPFAGTFARAALFTGDEKQAADWRKHMNTLAKDKQDAWSAARIDLMFSLAGATTEKPSAILDRLLAAAPYPPAPEPGKPAPPAPKNPTAADKQIDVRRIENTRALFLYAGTGRDLSPTHRALLATQRTAGRGVSDAAIARIGSAADQEANGEAALAIVSLLGPDTSALSFAGLADLLVQLRRVGLDKDADAIALESLQLWKAL